jgi:hypothetical protein
MSLVKDLSKTKFAVKYNGYTVTSTGRLLLASGFAPREDGNCLKLYQRKSATTMRRTRKGYGLQTTMRLYKTPASLLTSFFLSLVLPLSSYYPYTDFPVVLPIPRLPSCLTHLAASLQSSHITQSYATTSSRWGLRRCYPGCLKRRSSNRSKNERTIMPERSERPRLLDMHMRTNRSKQKRTKLLEQRDRPRLLDRPTCLLTTWATQISRCQRMRPT